MWRICSRTSSSSARRAAIALGLGVGLTAVASTACRAQDEPEPAATPSVTITLRDLAGEDVGRATLTEGALGILIEAALEGLPPGTHALHVHESGLCEPPFESAGRHLSVPGTEHGFFSPNGKHVGDLPNVHVPGSGAIAIDAFVEGATLGERGEMLPLLDDDGSALVLHAGADDYRTDPAGNAGDRIACGAITR